MFKKVLIANRGEIAVRIARTLQQMGIRAVAVHSDPDRRAVHVGCADEAYSLEGNTAAETYLRGDKIIEIAKRCGAEAIHPGYGFLSENPTFARQCQEAKLVFIGPTAEAMEQTGNKIRAKESLKKAGVPVVPGWAGDADTKVEMLAREAKRIGYPVLVKAAAGGGGKGMRLVRDERDFVGSFEASQREASAAFGDSHVFIEKYIEYPRHVEIQILADQHGNVVHMFERECSIQRRHQKIIEESPSPVLTPELRSKMGEAAVRAAQVVNYTNAGTVEFLVDKNGDFYFLEVNTRLQVEHPVTEMTLGLDLVRAQVYIAAGEKLPFAQDDLQQNGHAIECRIYAEDASTGFLPSTGTIERYVPPMADNVRVDSGVNEGSIVSTYYDPMLAKLICWGPTREHALSRMQWALDRYVVLGVITNIEFLRSILADEDFKKSEFDTQFLERHGRRIIESAVPGAPPDEALIAAGLAARPAAHSSFGLTTDGINQTPWAQIGTWRGV